MNPKDRKAAKVKNYRQKEKEQMKVLAGKYQIQKEIGKGVSSNVFSAIDILNGEKVAIKKIRQFLQNKHQSLRILREILLLRKLKHPNIINLKQVIVEDKEGKELSLILQFLPLDIKKIFKSNYVLALQNIKSIIFQILLGLNYCQQSQVLHRDLKPQNILITDDLSEVKLCDFGLARAVVLEVPLEENQQNSMKAEEEEKPKGPKVNLTAHVTTRWYRAPELILLERKYNSAIDIWSVGCILGELMTMTEVFTERKPLFPGKACYPLSPPKTSDMNYKKINEFPHSVYDQLSVIFSIIGTPTDIDFISDERARNYIKSFEIKPRKPFSQVFKFVSADVEDFLQKSLQFNPNKRMTISQALNHKLFDDVRQRFEKNREIKGEPISMELEGVDLAEIKQLVMKEAEYYHSLNQK